MEILPDHVHLRVDVNLKICVFRIVNKIQGYISRTLREEFPELKRKLPTLWTFKVHIISWSRNSRSCKEIYRRTEGKMRRTNTFKLKPTKEQEKRLFELAENCSRLWNEINYRRRQSFFSGEIDWNTDEEYNKYNCRSLFEIQRR